jgi:signal transduction histidine kinase
MWPTRAAEFLLPAAERDEGFRQEILRLSHIGLRVVGLVQIAVSAFMMLARMLVAPEESTLALRLAEGGTMIASGVTAILLTRWQRTYRYSRLISGVMAFFVVAVLTSFSLALSPGLRHADDFVPGQITLVMLVAIAALPLKPMHVMSLGLSAGIFYAGVARLGGTPGRPEPTYLLFIVMLTLLSTGLTAVVYHQRVANYRAYVSTLQAAEDLRHAQSRVLLAENAASLGRLSAALSHELNSPIGALMSGVDTMVLLAAKQANASPQEQQRLVLLQADLRRSVRESAKRLQEIVARMQRFTNLDKAEVQEANVNELLSDVTALLEPQIRQKATIQLNLAPVPPLVCRPQQLSAVFSNLLANAIGAVNGDGRIVVSTRHVDSGLEVRIEDNGRGVPPEQLKSIFDPGFKVSGERVSTGNWSMFSSRQIVHEHGGEIHISSALGRGTIVVVTLPLRATNSRTELS